MVTGIDNRVSVWRQKGEIWLSMRLGTRLSYARPHGKGSVMVWGVFDVLWGRYLGLNRWKYEQ